MIKLCTLILVIIIIICFVLKFLFNCQCYFSIGLQYNNEGAVLFFVLYKMAKRIVAPTRHNAKYVYDNSTTPSRSAGSTSVLHNMLCLH